MQSGTHCELVEAHSFTGNKHLANIFVLNEHLPLELIYPLTVTRSAIYIRRREVGWRWANESLEAEIIEYLCSIRSLREEIYLEVCTPEPYLPGYPEVDYNPKDYPVVIGIDDAVKQGEIDDDALRDALEDDLPDC